MNSISLFEVNKNYSQALSNLYDMEQDGAIDEQTFLDTMEGLEGELTAKAKSVGAYIRNTTAMAEQIRQAEANMARRRKSLESHAKGLTDYLLHNMLDSGITAITSPYFDLKVKKTPPSVAIGDGVDLPSEFINRKEVVTETPDKMKLKKALQAGEEIKGVQLKTGYRLEIK